MSAHTPTPEQLIGVPAIFYDDHMERELPTPVERVRTGNLVWVRLNDRDLAELLNDAEYYAKDVDCAPKYIIASARRTVDKIRKVCEVFGVSLAKAGAA